MDFDDMPDAPPAAAPLDFGDEPYSPPAAPTYSPPPVDAAPMDAFEMIPDAGETENALE
jgi:hypothetical protein